MLRVYSHSFNVVVALKGDAWEVETIDKLPEGTQPQISVEELLLCEDIIRADERVIKLAKDIGQYLFCCGCVVPMLTCSLQALNRISCAPTAGLLATTSVSPRNSAFNRHSSSFV